MQNSTLHIKVKPEIAKGLKKLSRKKETSVGELVRRAVTSCYLLDGSINRNQADDILQRMIRSGFYSPVRSIGDIV